jgi:hypothetical protein
MLEPKLVMTTGAPPSITRSTLLVLLTEAMPMVVEVPVKVKEIPEPGQLSSLVFGLTRPR